MTALKTKIIDTLTKGDIKMIPKWRIALYSFGIISALLFLFLVAVFSLSLIFFLLSRYGFMYLPMFGFMTILHMVRAVPLPLLLCTVVLLVVIEVISRKSEMSFRRPLAVTLLLVTTVTVLLSFFIGVTPVHEYIRDYARDNNITMMSDAYRRPLAFRDEDDVTVLRGNVTTASTSFIMLELFDGVQVKAYASSTMKDLILPSEGADVLLFGNFVNGNFEIVGIKNAPNIPFEKRRHSQNMRGMMNMMPRGGSEINMFRP